MDRVCRCHLQAGLVVLACLGPTACEQGHEPKPPVTAKQTAAVAGNAMRREAGPSVEDPGLRTPPRPEPAADPSSRPAPPQVVATRIRDAFLNERFHEVWHVMSKSAQDRFVRERTEARQAGRTDAPELFVRYWQEQFKAGPGTRDEIRASTILGVKVTGAVATVTLRDRDDQDQHMELILEEGAWKLNRLPDS